MPMATMVSETRGHEDKTVSWSQRLCATDRPPSRLIRSIRGAPNGDRYVPVGRTSTVRRRQSHSSQRRCPWRLLLASGL